MAPINNRNPSTTSNSSKKQTGTVPKTTTSSSSSANSSNSLLLGMAAAAASGKAHTSTPSSKSRVRGSASAAPGGGAAVVAATNMMNGSISVARKNTEVVAPTRRDLNDLNDYFFTVTESQQPQQLPSSSSQQASSSSTAALSSSSTVKQQNIVGHNNSNHLDATCFELDNFQENHRFCFPVRPIPRRNNSTRDLSDNFHTNNQTNSSGPANSAATVGVVIPTTPSGTVLADDSRTNSIPQQSSINSNLILEDGQFAIDPSIFLDLESDLSWEQRLSFIQCFLSLTSKSTTNKVSNMVNEINPNEIIVNSASLEDVAHSEASVNRAQSITSIHSAHEPTTPTYDELQTRLDNSNRNIQNIKDQQQQLLRLQQTAKQHLSDMESLRQRSAPLRYGQNGATAPDYESVEEVHNDMSGLVNRMKNLTTFIQGQHELSAMLGDDGPEVMAEQEALLRKLESLKTHREEMRSLVNELQNANATVQQQQEPEPEPPVAAAAAAPAPARVVPVEYQRIVPIELVGASYKPEQTNGHAASATTEEEEEEEEEEPVDPATAECIRQKMADINAMKSQLKRLKDMMETVKLIEDRTEGAKSVKDIGCEETTDEELTEEPPAPPQRDVSNGPAAAAAPAEPQSEDEQHLSEKVRLLNEVTHDLRAQALHLASERDRIKAIKEEIQRRREATNRSGSETPTKLVNKDTGKDLLRAEYEEKKKEFERICLRLNSEEATIVNESEDEEQQKNEEASDYYPEQNWRDGGASCNSSVRGSVKRSPAATAAIPLTPNRGKESADSGAADVHGVASLEAGSLQSGSSRSFSMPPPMRSINNNRETPWRKNSQDHTQQFDPYGHPQTGPVPPPLPASWNPYYFYNATPYSPHFPPLPSSSAGPSNEFPFAFLPSGAAASQPPSGSHDPVLLQQFIQTQQMLINSVSQCNQLLWHQQREINNLNNAVLLLQERLLNASDLAASTIRAESVPPNVVTNSHYVPLNRAQSEQPQNAPNFPLLNMPLQSHQMRPPFLPFNFNHSQHHSRRNLTAYNYATSSAVAADNHQQSSSMYSAAANLCPQLPPMHPQMTYNNNVNANGHQPQSNAAAQHFLNNDISLNSANIQQAPIFMHHHNNTIGSSSNSNQQQQQQQQPNNNSNLLSAQQNCLSNSNVQNNGSSSAASALNNQVPPGNRANNYWDNFRSYSRQNLLSSNSCKSNEEQNQQHQHIQQLQQLEHQQQLFVNSTSGYRNQQQQQQQHHSASNNLNFDSKYLHTFRNEFNGHGPPQQQQQQTMPSEMPGNSFVNNSSFSNLENWSNCNLFDGNSSSLQTLYHGQDSRNMNLNFGNHEQKKIPIKTAACNSTKRLRLSPTSSSCGLQSAAAAIGGQASQQPPVNDNNYRYADMSLGAVGGDEPSDEIKRNLLVNALKSDKFTTKFFETLKEDVYRQAFSLIQRKENYPGIFHSNADDPLREIFLNAIQDLGKPSDNNRDQEQESKSADENLAKEDNFDNNDAANALGMNPKDIKMLAYKFVQGSGNSAKGKFEERNENIVSVGGGAEGGSADGQPQPSEAFCPDYDLVNFIMSKVAEECCLSSFIDDVILVRVAKLTASIVQNSSAVNLGSKSIKVRGDGRTHISPKKIFAKMMKIQLPRDPERFLNWYKTYLEDLFVIRMRREEEVNVNLESKAVLDAAFGVHDGQKTQKSNLQYVLENDSKIDNPQLDRNSVSNMNLLFDFGYHADGGNGHLGTPSTPGGNNIMNEDLAEADQICSSSNAEVLSADGRAASFDDDLAGAVAHPVENGISSSTAHQHTDRSNYANFYETENNENPGEEAAAAACAFIAQDEDAEDDGQILSVSEFLSLDPIVTSSSATGTFGKRNSVP